MALCIIQTLPDLRSFGLKEVEKGKKWNSNISEVVAKFFTVGKEYETKVMEEYCRAITWALGWWCCGWSGFRVLEFGSQLDRLIYTHIIGHTYVELWSAHNLSEHRCNYCASWGVSVTVFVSSVMLFVTCWVTVLFVIQCSFIGVYWKTRSLVCPFLPRFNILVLIVIVIENFITCLATDWHNIMWADIQRAIFLYRKHVVNVYLAWLVL